MFLVEDLALYLARCQHIFGEGVQDGLFSQAEAQRLHAPSKPTLPPSDRGQRLRQPLGTPAKGRPIVPVMDVVRPIHRTPCGDSADSSPPAQEYSPHNVRRIEVIIAAKFRGPRVALRLRPERRD